jgi:hypothetical protein
LATGFLLPLFQGVLRSCWFRCYFIPIGITATGFRFLPRSFPSDSTITTRLIYGGTARGYSINYAFLPFEKFHPRTSFFRILNSGRVAIIESGLILWNNLYLFIYWSWLHGFRTLSLLMPMLLTVPTREDQGCTLPWSSMRAIIGIVIRISTNKTASQLAITVVGKSYWIVEIRSLTWSYLISPVFHCVRSNRKLGYLSSSVRRLYLVDRGCLLRFLFRLSIKYLLFRINIMDPFWRGSLAFACIMTQISTPSAPNIHPGGRNGSS